MKKEAQLWSDCLKTLGSREPGEAHQCELVLGCGEGPGSVEGSIGCRNPYLLSLGV